MTSPGLPADDLDRVLKWAREPLEELRGGRLFLSGGTGFFGQWLLASLLHADSALGLGLKVVVLTRDPAAFRHRAPGLAGHSAVELWPGDVRWFEYPKGECTHVVHAAADTNVAAAAQPLRLLDTIVGGTRRMLDYSVLCNARRFLFVSSGAVYGELPADPALVPEGFPGGPDPADPSSAYGEAKRLAEQLCSLYDAESRVPSVVARCFAFVGPLLPLDAHFAVGNFIRDALFADSIRVRGDGSPVRSYLYAADLSAWLLTLLVRGTPGRPYNVGSDQSITVRELAQRVADAVAPGKPVVVDSKTAAPGARSRYVPAVARAREELGLKVWTDLPDALRRTAEWVRSRGPVLAGVPKTAPSLVPRTFVIDVDGVLATLSPGNDYALAAPLRRNIEAVNRLHDAGHRIVLFTARGTVTGLDWRAVTEGQFREWGLRYHELVFGKPAADYYVDDRMIPVDALREMA